MSEYATKGAMMMCSCGTAPAQLQVTSNSLLHVQGNLVATTSDKAPNTNIMPFGNCTVKPYSPPCTPAPTAWVGFLTSLNVPGGNPLLKTSMIQCASGGGIIKFQESGQKKSAKVVLNPDSPQIRALKNAAVNATPFCEECEKKEVKKDPEIINIYWLDEEGKPRAISELYPQQEVTLCIDVEEGSAGKTTDLNIEAGDRKFKGGKTKLTYSNLEIESDNTAYIDNFSIEYEEE